MDDPEPPREDDERLHGRHDHAEHLHLVREVDDAEEDGCEEGQLEEAEDDEPGEEEEAHAPARADHENDGGEDEEELEGA